MPLHKPIDLTGQTFGRLTVIQKADTAYGAAHWLCICKCGIPTRVRGYQLRRGEIRSCGCLRTEQMRDMRARQLGRIAA
jgi:hypothetical protein